MQTIFLAAILSQCPGPPVGEFALPGSTQVSFERPARMNVFWLTREDGKTGYTTKPLEAPGRSDFAQAAIHRLKLTKLPGHPGVELFPTLEVVPSNPKAREFLARNAVPIRLTHDDVSEAVKGNLVLKVVYLATDPANTIAVASDIQGMQGKGMHGMMPPGMMIAGQQMMGGMPGMMGQQMMGGMPGMMGQQTMGGKDAISEAQQRGNILLVFRIGSNKNGPLINSGPLQPTIQPDAPPAATGGVSFPAALELPRCVNCRRPALGPAPTDCRPPDLYFRPTCWTPWTFSPPAPVSQK